MDKSKPLQEGSYRKGGVNQAHNSSRPAPPVGQGGVNNKLLMPMTVERLRIGKIYTSSYSINKWCLIEISGLYVHLGEVLQDNSVRPFTGAAVRATDFVDWINGVMK